MDALAAQLMYSLHRWEVEVVVAIYTLRGVKGRKADNALIMGVYHKLEFW